MDTRIVLILRLIPENCIGSGFRPLESSIAQLLLQLGPQSFVLVKPSVY